MNSHLRVPVVVLMVAFLIQPLGATPGFAQVAAPGVPYVDCSQAAAKYETLARGLDVQRTAIQRERARLDAFEQERAAGTKEAREQLMARTADTLKSHAAEELKSLKDLREKALKLPDADVNPLQAAARLKWMKGVSALDTVVSGLSKVAGAAGSGYAYGKEIQGQSHTIAEHLIELDKLFVESGLAEEIGGDLAKAGGPAGVALFEGSLFLLDNLLADMSDSDRRIEELDAADNYNNMTRALSEVEGKMANLMLDCPAQFGKATSTQSPATVSTSLTPPAPPTVEQPAVSAGKKSGGGGGKAVVVVLGLGVAAGAAVYAGKLAGDLASMSAGSCASNRFCIVSVMSSGCSCAGSVSGGCDWTGPTVGEGGGCGAGAPCASGLSCNNGRCEGPAGRCPF